MNAQALEPGASCTTLPKAHFQGDKVPLAFQLGGKPSIVPFKLCMTRHSTGTAPAATD